MPNDGRRVLDNKLILRPLIGLMDGRSQQEIEDITILEMQKHRGLRDEVSKLEASLVLGNSAGDLRTAERAYVSAMIAMHAQQTVVSTLLEILTYVPEEARRPAH